MPFSILSAKNLFSKSETMHTVLLYLVLPKIRLVGYTRNVYLHMKLHCTYNVFQILLIKNLLTFHNYNIE